MFGTTPKGRLLGLDAGRRPALVDALRPRPDDRQRCAGHRRVPAAGRPRLPVGGGPSLRPGVLRRGRDDAVALHAARFLRTPQIPLPRSRTPTCGTSWWCSGSARSSRPRGTRGHSSGSWLRCPGRSLAAYGPAQRLEAAPTPLGLHAAYAGGAGRLGRASRRGGGARAARSRSASRSRAATRLRCWDRCSAAMMTSRPPVSRAPSACSARRRCTSSSAAVACRSHSSSTRLSEVLTDCPPGPEDRENL